MTLRLIVARILRELIALAECSEGAELVAALHDALDVASPAGRLQHWSDIHFADRRVPAAAVKALSANV